MVESSRHRSGLSLLKSRLIKTSCIQDRISQVKSAEVRVTSNIGAKSGYVGAKLGLSRDGKSGTFQPAAPNSPTFAKFQVGMSREDKSG